MKKQCEACGVALSPDGEAYVCSFECTFCPSCSSKKMQKCPNCGGELVRRPQRLGVHGDKGLQNLTPPNAHSRGWVIWAISFGVWTFVALAGSWTIWQLYRTTEMPMRFRTTLWLEMSQILTYAPLTPFAYALAVRYPIRSSNWKQRAPLYLAAGLAFSIMHVALRGVTPYAIYEAKDRDWSSAIWNAHTHVFGIQWAAMRKLFLNNVVDDITGTFTPIVLVAHAISYYRKFQEREFRTMQLEGQLAKSHLQALKSQLQPHFLFNTMHSVSALMLTDVQAADRMITRLADLLRMNLESAGTQITSLNKELEFVNCYLEIEQVRFEERLRVIFDVAPETLDAQVPLLLLQPLVDNAVKHGISRVTEGGEIRISSFIQNDHLKLEVKDNGPGIRPSSNERGCGLGLRVTRERMETLYGENQSVEVSSPPEGGVSVVVTIPFRVAPETSSERLLSSVSGSSVALQARSV